MRCRQPRAPRCFLLLLLGAATSLLSCSRVPAGGATLHFTTVPPADEGGPEQTLPIAGTVEKAQAGQRVVLYARGGGFWWVQPFRSRPYTAIGSDGRWAGETHQGTDYAALVVDGEFRPKSRLDALPGVGGGVAAVEVVQGGPAAPPVRKQVHFSGYDWNVRSAGSQRGGEMNAYSADNAWVDGHGWLHLRMGMLHGRWSCAEVSLTRSLGYGTYRFVVQDSAHLGASAVVGMFTLDERKGEDVRTELDVELSRWGQPEAQNAQYVVQPYYVPENISRFDAPSGEVTHVLRWEPGQAAFKSYRGAAVRAGAPSLYEHTFHSGIPSAAAETVHFDLYDFRHAEGGRNSSSEVIIESFEYLP
jgi:hypothetical protein